MAPLSPDSTDAAPAKREDEGISIRPSTATKVQEEAKVLDEPRSFVPPFHAFATGSSSDDSPGGARNLFGDPASSTTLWGAGDQADEAPALLAPLGEPSTTTTTTTTTEPLFSPEESPSANPFAGQGGAATSLYADFRVADPDAPSPETGANPQPDAVKGPPALPTSAAMPAAGDAPSLVASTGAVAPAMPTVTSQPLGSKPKPKVRKGFVVLMVVIVGFASGAALASFVLPVEEYVAAARAFMESKLGTGAAVPQMPALPEGLTIPAPAAPPVDVQP